MRFTKFVIRLSPDERAVAHTQALGLRRHLFNADGKHSQVTLFLLPVPSRVELRHVRCCLHVLAFPALSRTLTACQAAADADHHRNLASYVCLSLKNQQPKTRLPMLHLNSQLPFFTRDACRHVANIIGRVARHLASTQLGLDDQQQ